MDEFYELLPREYAELAELHNEYVRHEELLTAIVAASVVNTSFCAPEKSKPFTDFMPSEWGKVEAKKVRAKRTSKAEREFTRSKISCFLRARSVVAPKES